MSFIPLTSVVKALPVTESHAKFDPSFGENKMGSMGVCLGVAGDMIGEGDSITHHVTKCGGPPWYPGEQSEHSPTSPKCDICKQDLALLLQAYAPLPSQNAGRSLLDRSLYLFGCIAPGCGKKPGSWKAIRAQLNQVGPKGGATKSSVLDSVGPTPAQCNAVVAPFGSGGAGFASNLQSVGEVAKPASPFDFPDLEMALNSLNDPSYQSSERSKMVKKGRGKGGSRPKSGHLQENAVPPSHMVSHPSTLPEFLIWSQPEPREGPKVDMSDKEKSHVEDLLSRYKATEASAENGGAKAEGPQQGGLSKPRQSWDGEKYESTCPVWKPFRAFQKRMARCPEQCVRYGFGGEFLCPRVIAGKVPPCQSCGSIRIFELQTMPPLLTYLAEASLWASQEGNLSAQKAANDALDTWDWTSVAVFTCEQSCSGVQNGLAITEECVCLYSED